MLVMTHFGFHDTEIVSYFVLRVYLYAFTAIDVADR